MNLICYPRLARCSQLAMKRTRWRYGNPYSYRPYRNLVKRLAQELGLSESQVRDKIEQERAWLLNNPWYN